LKYCASKKNLGWHLKQFHRFAVETGSTCLLGNSTPINVKNQNTERWWSKSVRNHAKCWLRCICWKVGALEKYVQNLILLWEFNVKIIYIMIIINIDHPEEIFYGTNRLWPNLVTSVLRSHTIKFETGKTIQTYLFVFFFFFWSTIFQNCSRYFLLNKNNYKIKYRHIGIVRQATNINVTHADIIAQLPNICLVCVEEFKKLTLDQLQGGKYSNLPPDILRSAKVCSSNNDQLRYMFLISMINVLVKFDTWNSHKNSCIQSINELVIN